MHDLRRVLLHREELQDLLICGDLAGEELATVTPEDTADLAMQLLRQESAEELPVVDSRDPGRLVGTVSRRTLLDTYYREIFQRDLAGEVLEGVRASDRLPLVPLVEGYFMGQLEVPGAFLGRSLRELDLRAAYDVQVVLIRRPATGKDPAASVSMVPSPDERLRRGDVLVVVGKEDSLRTLHAL